MSFCEFSDALEPAYLASISMTTFHVKTVSGGIVRQRFTIQAANLQECAAPLNATIVQSCPGWAFARYGATTSAEITWS